ncbi:MAG: hypothetical protein HOO96_07800 [Polyangiaceae bacterium]|nr:hypothetical protein [Polyangiaceae bacterium]
MGGNTGAKLARLGIEYELCCDENPEDKPEEYFNTAIVLTDGAKYALNVWTYDFAWTTWLENEEQGFTHGPDLLVSSITRPDLERTARMLIATGALRETWRVHRRRKWQAPPRSSASRVFAMKRRAGMFPMRIELTTGEAYVLSVCSYAYAWSQGPGVRPGASFMVCPDVFVASTEQADLERLANELVAAQSLRKEWRVRPSRKS